MDLGGFQNFFEKSNFPLIYLILRQFVELEKLYPKKFDKYFIQSKSYNFRKTFF